MGIHEALVGHLCSGELADKIMRGRRKANGQLVILCDQGTFNWRPSSQPDHSELFPFKAYVRFFLIIAINAVNQAFREAIYALLGFQWFF